MGFGAEEGEIIFFGEVFDEEVIVVGVFAEVVVKVGNYEFGFFVSMKKIVKKDNGIDAARDGEKVF